jgi:cell division initiation protein
MTMRKPLSPIDIQSVEFHRRLRGFDPEEVHLFLQTVAESYQALTLENHQQGQELEHQKAALDEFRHREDLLREALYTAQKLADELKAQAAREAQSIVQEAQVRSEAVLQQAQLRAHQVDRSILDLKMEREHHMSALRDLLHRTQAILDAIEESKAKENVASFGRDQG